MKFSAFLFSAIIYLSSLISEEYNVSNALSLFPNTISEIETFGNKALEEIETAQKHFNELAPDQLNYQSVVIRWNQMIGSFVWKQAILAFYSIKTSDKDLLEKAGMKMESLTETLIEALSDEKSINIVISYAKQVIEKPQLENLNPSEIYLLSDLIKSIKDGVPASQKEAADLYQKITQKKMIPYKYLKGNAPESQSTKKISILNWNVCCFDGGLSMFFGGVLPWQNRIDRIGLFIKNSGPDIICLQELFSSEAAERLYLALKDSYAHFYIDIGPKICGFNPRALGVPSGLFVASKFPLENPLFHPYNSEDTPQNRAYGFFSAEIGPIRLITTHLQPGNEPDDIKYRSKQLTAIAKKEDPKMPTFICGDFNIDRGSKEYESEMASFFLNHYNGQAWTSCELSNYWWKAKENVKAFLALGTKKEWIDYFLTFKKNPGNVLKTSLLIANDPENPPKALSDHQAMISIIELP